MVCILYAILVGPLKRQSLVMKHFPLKKIKQSQLSFDLLGGLGTCNCDVKYSRLVFQITFKFQRIMTDPFWIQVFVFLT